MIIATEYEEFIYELQMFANYKYLIGIHKPI